MMMTDQQRKAAETALQRAIKEIGTSELGRRIGVTPQAISQWKVVPAARVLDVERETGEPRHLLRPDFYPAPGTEDAA